MNMSFFTGAIGADASKKKLDIIANNLANINNNGFKPKKAVFTELLRYNLNDSEEARTELQAGASSIVTETASEFSQGALLTTGRELDFALLESNAFFKLQDPESGEISYTRNGHFYAAENAEGKFLLTTDSGKLVLDQNGEPLSAKTQDVEGILRDALRRADPEAMEEEEAEETTEEEEKPYLAVYTLPYPSRLINIGGNEYRPREGDTLNRDSLDSRGKLQSGVLESSATDMAKEMTRLIECQRAYSYALKMVQVSDETEGTINQLRG